MKYRIILRVRSRGTYPRVKVYYFNSQDNLEPVIHPKNIIMPNHQTVARLATSLFVGNFYLDEEIPHAKLRRTPDKGSSTQPLELSALAAK
jgi:hypothetical protein